MEDTVRQETGQRKEYLQKQKEKLKSSYSQDDEKQQTSKSITDMIMGNSYSKDKSSPPASITGGLEIVDTSTLVSQTQNRMEKALNGQYHYDSSLKDSQGFLFNYVNSKLSLVIMYADLVGSTNMTMTLPVDKMVTIIRAFTYEMTSTVRSYGGFVPKVCW